MLIGLGKDRNLHLHGVRLDPGPGSFASKRSGSGTLIEIPEYNLI
jgi:hypothetical protein